MFGCRVRLRNSLSVQVSLKAFDGLLSLKSDGGILRHCGVKLNLPEAPLAEALNPGAFEDLLVYPQFDDGLAVRAGERWRVVRIAS